MRRLVVLVGLAVLAGVGCGKPDGATMPAPNPPAAARAAVTREEFSKLVVGKTPDEVIAAVGKPDSTSEYGANERYWHYKDRTTDPATGKTDRDAQLVFRDGRVAAVNY